MGSRKYSVPRLVSAQGEEAARRAMPTSSVAGFVLRLGAGGGAEASHGDSQVPWRAAVGNRVRLVCFARFRGRWSVAGVARRMGKVAIDCLAARPTIYSPFVRYVKLYSSLSFRLYALPAFALETPLSARYPSPSRPIYSWRYHILLAGTVLAEVGILIIDDDIVSQRALKNVLDSEGWRVRIVPLASAAMLELASGKWSLVIVNVAMTDVRGPLFSILKDLAQGAADAPEGASVDENRPKRIRVLFLVPMLAVSHAQPILEQESLPYSIKPYHLHGCLGKVSELLVETGTLAEPIRIIGDFNGAGRRQQGVRDARKKRSSMFAARDDYQMSEEEMLEWERSEEEERKKREKEIWDREHL